MARQEGVSAHVDENVDDAKSIASQLFAGDDERSRSRSPRRDRALLHIRLPFQLVYQSVLLEKPKEAGDAIYFVHL